MSTSIKDNFNATGAGQEIPAASGAFVVTGTFVGTVELQRSIGGIWQTLAEYSAPTTPGSDVSFDNGVTVPMRFFCNSFTSGVIECALVGVAKTSGQ